MILDLGLADQQMFNSVPDGFGLLGWMRRLFSDEDRFPIIIHTENVSPETLALAQQHEVQAVFKKGDDLNELLSLVRQALDRAKAA